MQLAGYRGVSHHKGVHHYQARQHTRQQQPQGDSVTFGSYNVKNLFDDVDENSNTGAVAKPEKELRALANQIRQSGAQVIALQEVENLEVLQDFVNQYLPGQFSDVVLVEGNDRRGIDVAVISMMPIKHVESHKDRQFTSADGQRPAHFCRDLLRVDLDVKGHPWSLYTTHLKSKLGGPSSENQRLAEGREVRKIVAEEMGPWQKSNFVVMGDFNDTPDSNTAQAILRGDRGEERLLNHLDFAPKDQRFTFPAKKPKEQIDYIAFPEHLQAQLVRSGTVGGDQAKIASDHKMTTAEFMLTA